VNTIDGTTRIEVAPIPVTQMNARVASARRSRRYSRYIRGVDFVSLEITGARNERLAVVAQYRPTRY